MTCAPSTPGDPPRIGCLLAEHRHPRGLRVASQTGNLKLREIAETVILTGTLDA